MAVAAAAVVGKSARIGNLKYKAGLVELGSAAVKNGALEVANMQRLGLVGERLAHNCWGCRYLHWVFHFVVGCVVGSQC